MSNRRVFTTEELKNMGLPWGCFWEQHVSSTRWTEVWLGVFSYEGVNYLISWDVGLTEMQEIGPWDDVSRVTAIRAESYQHVETRWRPVQGEAA